MEGVFEVVVVRLTKYVSGQPWDVEIQGWNVPNYRFKWYDRFEQKKFLSKVDYLIRNVNAAKLAVFNRIFEKPK